MRHRQEHCFIVCEKTEMPGGDLCFVVALHTPAQKRGQLVWREFSAGSYADFPQALEKLRALIAKESKNSAFSVDIDKTPLFQDGLRLDSIAEAR